MWRREGEEGIQWVDVGRGRVPWAETHVSTLGYKQLYASEKSEGGEFQWQPQGLLVWKG